MLSRRLINSHCMYAKDVLIKPVMLGAVMQETELYWDRCITRLIQVLVFLAEIWRSNIVLLNSWSVKYFELVFIVLAVMRSVMPMSDDLLLSLQVGYSTVLQRTSTCLTSSCLSFSTRRGSYVKLFFITITLFLAPSWIRKCYENCACLVCCLGKMHWYEASFASTIYYSSVMLRLALCCYCVCCGCLRACMCAILYHWYSGLSLW